MKSRTATAAAESAEEVLTQLRNLVAEAEHLLSEQGNSVADVATDSLRHRLAHLTERMEQAYGQAREKITTGARQADTTIRSHPYESLAVALGVGVLLGALLKRNH